MPYLRKRASRHSCAPIYFPFTFNKCDVSHAPVFITQLKLRKTWTGSPYRVSTSASSDRLVLHFHTSSFTSLRHLEWSAVLNFYYPLSDVMSCSVMTQESVHFSGAFSIGSGRSRTSSFTGKRVTSRPGIPSPTPWKREKMNDSQIAFLAGPKVSTMLGVTRCTNSHSYWSDFCSTA